MEEEAGTTVVGWTSVECVVVLVVVVVGSDEEQAARVKAAEAQQTKRTMDVSFINGMMDVSAG